MQIRRLRLVNFRQHADTTIELEGGLTGIVGPNGSGKTTLLEAIAWAMYGTQASRGTRDSIRRRSAAPRSRVEVELDFVLGPHRYRVVRSLQNATLYQDDEAAAIANSPGAVTDKVTRLLGMTLDEFFNTYFTGQKELAIMASMSAPDRARFLSRVLGYERLAVAQVRLKEERTALKAALTTAETGLIDLAVLEQEERSAVVRGETADKILVDARAAFDAAETVLARERPRFAALEERRNEVQAVDTDLSIAKHQGVEARRAFDALDKDLAEALAAAAKRDSLLPELAPWDELLARRDRLDQEAQAFAGRRAIEAQVAEVKTAMAELDRRLVELPEPPALEAARSRAEAVQSEVLRAGDEVEQLHTAWVRNKQDAETKRQSLLQQHADFDGQIKRLKQTGPAVVCPTCGKPLGKEYQTVLEDLEAKRDEIKVQGLFYKRRGQQLDKEPTELVKAQKAKAAADAKAKQSEGAIAKLEAGLTERTRVLKSRSEAAKRLSELAKQLEATPGRYDEPEHRHVRARITVLTPIRDQVVRLAAAAERAASLVPKAAQAEQALSRIEVRIKELTDRLRALGWSAEAFERARAEFQAAERARQSAEVAFVRAEAERSAALEHRAAIARRRVEREARAAGVERLKDDFTLNQELDRAFTDLRDELNATLRPDLSDAASVLLRDLSTGRYADLELNEDYVPTVVDDGEAKQVISGGEEDIANLALRLSISQMIADRAGQPFSLLILDEIFGSLDEERRTAVVDLLRSLADRFPQVILITHIESVRDGFDRVIRIEYDVARGLATAREERTEEVPHVAA